MNANLTKKLAAGMLLAASAASADVVLDDFHTGWAGRNNFGAPWIADADVYVCDPPGSTTCGTSTVTDAVPGLSGDVVKNSANVAAVYDGSGAIISKIKVSKDVSVAKNWAYAGWVMDILPADTTGAGPEPWNQPQWLRKNDVDISGCTALQLKLSFTPNRQLWVEVTNSQQAKLHPDAPSPQYGWRRATAAATMETWVLPLAGLGKPNQKWSGTASDPAIDLKQINRIKILYEGQTGINVATPAPYDAVEHTLTISNISLIGGTTCKVAGVSAIAPRALGKDGLSVSETAGKLAFAGLKGLGELKVRVLDLSGKVRSQGAVSESHPSLAVAGMKDGVYAVQVSGATLRKTFSVSHLD